MKKLITGFMTIALLSAVLTGCGADSETQVTVASARAGKDLSAMVWQGTVEALRNIDVMPNSAGKIVEVPVKEGDHVEAGTVLFKVDDQNAGLSLAQANAAYQAAQAAFTSAEKTSRQNTAVRPAEIAYNTARDNFNRLQVLYAGGDISQQDYENAKAQADSAAAQLEAAKNGQTSGYDGAKAQLDGARAALDIAQKAYDDCAVKSPIAGMVSDMNLEVGQMVSPQIKAASVIDDSGRQVEIKVADLDIDQLKVGTSMNASLQTLGESCGGIVTEISPVSDPATGMFTVKVALEEASRVSYIGLTADLRVNQSEENASVYVPAKSIRSDDSGSFVFKVTDGTVNKAAVSEGRKKNAYIEVKEGLDEGDEVVVQSSRPLEDGDKVKVLTVK